MPLRMRGEAAAASFPTRTLLKRHMSDGAIAGTVVGVVVGVALLALCLYPVILFLFKRRRQGQSPNLNIENGHAAPNDAQAPPETGQHRRLSSNDSLKQDGELSRGAIHAAPANKEWGWTPRSEPLGQPVNGHSLTWPISPGDLQAAANASIPATIQSPPNEYGLHSSLSPTPFYAGEYMPVSEVRDDQPGVLRGTSADYYSPSIPSEAFGMVAMPVDAPTQLSSESRSSSMKIHVKSIFGRTGRQDRIADSQPSPVGTTRLHHTSPFAPVPYDGIIPQQTVDHGMTIESTVAPSSTPAGPTTFPSETPDKAQAESHAPVPRTPPEPTQLERSFQPSPPSPFYPAPGTVNPMDIMPASTETEVWHRTEHELSATYNPRPNPDPLPQAKQTGYENNHAQYAFSVTSPSPPTAAPSKTFPDIAPAPPPIAEAQVDQDGPLPPDFAMGEAHAQNHERTSIATDSSENPNRLSDQSPAFPGPGSTDLSSHETPSTQVDSPSPGSLNSSDFRHSVSPQSMASTVRPGVFHCDEPGCQQVFDQPHKLKHHQRYHSKDHKCPYANCGKGFGTKTHLQRHINDRHEKKKKFHCSVSGCDYSRAGGKAFPRKDNWKRHMTKIHNMDQANLPEPVEIDQEMSGV
ncbi:hypothetical protein HIM_04932 [Hirsutella minnesotensis 3608]|uniref:C2H2 type master regulator of conidiophore development brlA n=1 Tax=Hirsutella minnesotensis 3608 TaxID=1043627 RepID=A0A0F7ZPM8_9HYPO|nr:hypothetical protein HIM_04932 [Hirsutella minnesotensis 3608]